MVLGKPFGLMFKIDILDINMIPFTAEKMQQLYNYVIPEIHKEIFMFKMLFACVLVINSLLLCDI